MKRVVVIGAGPAGSAAAMALCRFRGVETLLLDRATFPRRKVCGSGLSPWCLDLLDELGVGPAVRREAYTIHGALIGGASGRPVELRGKYAAAILLRERFDSLLAHEAARRGAELREGVRVEAVARENGRLLGIRTAGGEIEADALIDCSGANGKLSRLPRRGKRLHTIMGWYEGVEGVTDAVELYFDAVVKPYYGWVFPESRERVNIGLCYGPRPGGPNARERFAVFVEHRLAPRMKHAVQVDRLVGHPIATSYRPAALVDGGTLVAGEAGDLVDPATAEGIHHALASGIIAGRLLGTLFEQGLAPSKERLAPYTRLVRRRVGARLLAGQVLLEILKTPIFDLALRFGGSKPVRGVLHWALAGA